MDIEKKLEELTSQKIMIEQQVAQLQQHLGSLNVAYLKIMGKIEAYKEMKEE